MQRRTGITVITLVGLGLGLAARQAPHFGAARLDPTALVGALHGQAAGDAGGPGIKGSPEPAAIKFGTVKGGRVRATFELPGYTLEPVVVDGVPCSRLAVAGLAKLMVADLPEVPVATAAVALPTSGSLRLEIIEHVVREVAVDPVEPSKGHLDRNIDPATVTARFDPLYKDGGVWPAEPAVVGEVFLLQEQAGVTLRVQPLRYDATGGKLLVTERLVVEIIAETSPDKLPAELATEFRAVGRALFGASLPLSVDKYEALPTLGRMLIIAPQKLAAAAAPLVQWKLQRGLPTELVTVPNSGVTSADIAAIINAAYNEPAGLVWVILVGDRAEIPPAVGHYDGSDSDTRYAMVSGSDIYPDLFISRISAATDKQVATQVAKFIAYEKTPATGADAAWYGRALLIAGADGTPTDAERADLLRADLLTHGYIDVQRIYEGQGGTTSGIREAVNAGVGLINYLGHGSGFSWESVPFRQGNIAALGNTGQLPWIIDVSCSNGNLALDTCFAESWLRAGTANAPAGAIGMIAATSIAPWVPPTVMQAEAIDLLATDRATTFGAMCFSGLMLVADRYAGQPVAERVVEQNMIYGDCSLMVRTAAPTAFTVTGSVAPRRGATNLHLAIAGAAGSVVTLTGDGILYATAFIADGGVDLPLGDWAADLASVVVTATGRNMVPWIATVSLTGEGVLPDPGLRPAPAPVTLRGNFPNPFNPRTVIAFDLPLETAVNLRIYNIRGHLVQDLSAASLPAGPNEVAWDGQDHTGHPSPSGVYLYRLEAAGQTLTGRMTLSK